MCRRRAGNRNDPGGVAAISRWLSAAIPPARIKKIRATPAGVEADRAATPAGVGRQGRHRYRGCRFAQPLADRCDPCRGRTPNLGLQTFRDSMTIISFPQCGCVFSSKSLVPPVPLAMPSSQNRFDLSFRRFTLAGWCGLVIVGMLGCDKPGVKKYTAPREKACAGHDAAGELRPA